jgi:hypothetical protein
MKRIIYIICISLFLPGFSINCQSQNSLIDTCKKTSNTITFNSSDSNLNKVFLWAKNQALAYAFNGDPVGQWYEAALPGREAFCMRDVSHQAMGAHFLGLASYTKNMLLKFAQNISDSKDWCSLWEINSYGQPPLVDYLNEAEFWYNLPANFDIMDCCYRMYILTGDQDYFNDPVFLNFYEKTVKDYVKRWDLGIDKIMTRQRLMNTHGLLDTNRRFMMARGIPGYNEGDPGYILATDLLVTERAAFLAYARFQQLRGNDAEAKIFLDKTQELDKLLTTSWWDSEGHQFYTHLNEKHELVSQGPDESILYWHGTADSARLEATIKAIVKNLPLGPVSSIEGQSHLPEILYEYDESGSAYKQLLFVSKNNRREYPEASYSAIGAMVSGLMGIELDVYPPADAVRNGGYVDRIIATKSRLTGNTAWAEINHVIIRKNDISVRHEGVSKTIVTNNSGPAVIWKATFQGSFDNLFVNGSVVKARKGSSYPGGPKMSWTTLTVAPGTSITVKTFK